MQSVFKDNLFEGRTALVTGGGTGIGLRTAREIAALGATVIIAGRKQEKLDAGSKVITDEGGQCHTIVCNIRDEDSVQACISHCLELTGQLDFVVNNAGGQFPSPAEAISKKGWHAVIETNLTGTFLISREAYNQAMKKTGGAIVNVIADMWRGFPYMVHTGAARAGVDNLTKTLAVEWGRKGVRVNAVAPGVINSSGLNSYAPEFRPMVMAAAQQNQAWRLGSEAEVAAAICFLLSPAAAFITGETLKVDGGQWLYHPKMPPVEHDRLPPYEDQ